MSEVSELKEKLQQFSYLVVDDEAEARGMIVKHLERLTNHKADIYSAEDGQQGLELFKDKEPNIVISDIMMPVMNGLEMCQEIRKINRESQLLVFTAYGDREQMIKAIDSGVNHFLFKPFEIKIFKATLEQSIDQLIHLQKLQKAKDESEHLLLAQSKQAAMGEMLSMIAHQWRQPLTSASMSANNMIVDIEMQSVNLDEFKELLEAINRNIQYLSKTIDDFKDYFKPTKEKKNIKISVIIEKTLEIIGKSLENNNIDCKIEYKKDIPLDIFDNELMQVLLNLINNSKDAILSNKIEGGHIDITTDIKNDFFEIEISDNGGGIPKEVEENIFKAYFTTKGKKGTGLGLHMCDTIVNKHLNGRLNFKNTKDGVTFKILLPINTSEG